MPRTPSKPPLVSFIALFGGWLGMLSSNRDYDAARRSADKTRQGGTMGSLLRTMIFVLLASPLGLQAADVKLGTCETSVGAWEFTTKEGGRAVIAKEGGKYHVLWLTSFTNTSGTAEPEGVAAECTCHDGSNKLLWRCRVAFSFQTSDIGTEQNFEWIVDGGTLNSWYIAPDGKRSATGIRRPK